MQEIRRENGLLLQLVKSLEGEINSKNKENQLLFTQYQQLAGENRQLANHNSALMQENQALKRAQAPKENNKYSYAILNSPRTQKLQAQMSELTQQMARQRNESQQTLLQLQNITKQKEQLRLIVLQLEKSNQEQSIRKSNQRIDYLQKDLWRKEKEMKELTLIMYAKDATASEISFKQEEKNRQIDVLKKQIERLRGQKERDYKMNEQQRQNQQRKKTERIQMLQIMLEQAIKKGNQQRKIHQDYIETIAELQNSYTKDKELINSLQNELNQQRIRNRQRQLTLLAQLQLKSRQAKQKAFESNLNQFTIVNHQQSINIKIEQQRQQRNSSIHPQKCLFNQLRLQQQKLIQIKRQCEEYRRQLQSSLMRLSQIQQFNNNYKQQIAQSQKIKMILVSQIQKNDLIIKEMKKQISQLEIKGEQINQLIDSKSAELYSLGQQLLDKQNQHRLIQSNNQSLIRQKEILQKQLNTYRQEIEHKLSAQQRSQENMLENQRQITKLSQLEKQQLKKQLQQMQQSSNTFMQILQTLQEQLRNKQSINQQLRQAHQHCAMKLQSFQSSLQKISQLQRQKEQMSKLLQKYIQQCSQNKDRICQLQSQITDLTASVQKRKASNMDTAQRPVGQHYVEMLNAVIEQIKSQHQSSISKIQSKNILIQELERRLKQSQDHHQQQISTLRTSIATGQLQQIDFQSLSKKYRHQQPSKASEDRCVSKGLQQSLQALRQQIRKKDVIIQQLSLFKVKTEQQKQKMGVMNLSSICLNQTTNDKNKQICDNSHRIISSIISPDNSEQHHYNEQYEDPPSQIQIENQQLQQTVEQLNYVIASLQNELIMLQNHYNSEIMQLQKTIARTNAEVIALRRSIAESNPKLPQLDKLARDFCVRPEPSRLSSKNALRNRMNSPNQIDLTYSGEYKANLSQSITKLSKSSLFSPNLNSSHILPRPSDSSFHQPQSKGTNSSNPYIKQMTDQKGNLKFPSSGNWSIEQLRSILQ